MIDIKNKDKSIIPNLITEVTVEKDFTKEAIIISSTSVLTDSEGNKYVYIYQDGRAYKRSIEGLYVKGNKTQIPYQSQKFSNPLLLFLREHRSFHRTLPR